MSLSVLAGAFPEIPEFHSRFGGASADNGGFVDLLYLNVLGRAAEPDGRDYWVGMLDRGEASRAEMLVTSRRAARTRPAPRRWCRTASGTAARPRRRWRASTTPCSAARPTRQGWSAGRPPSKPARSPSLQLSPTLHRQRRVPRPVRQPQQPRLRRRDLREHAGPPRRRGRARPLDGATRRRRARAEVVLAFSESAGARQPDLGHFGGENPREYGILFA